MMSQVTVTQSYITKNIIEGFMLELKIIDLLISFYFNLFSYF